MFYIVCDADIKTQECVSIANMSVSMELMKFE